MITFPFHVFSKCIDACPGGVNNVNYVPPTLPPTLPPTPPPTPAPVAPVVVAPATAVAAACTDSPNWADHFGSPCQIYIDHGRCIDGAITTMQTREEMSGWATIAPYDACCACGRGVAPRVVPTTCVTCSGSTNVDGYWGTYTGLTKGSATYGPFTCMEGSDGLLTFRGHGSCP